jgi:hypothetical protein
MEGVKTWLSSQAADFFDTGIFFSMALQPLWALAALFQFPNLYTGGRTP